MRIDIDVFELIRFGFFVFAGYHLRSFMHRREWRPSGIKCQCGHVDRNHSVESPHDCKVAISESVCCACNFFVVNQDKEVEDLRKMVGL